MSNKHLPHDLKQMQSAKFEEIPDNGDGLKWQPSKEGLGLGKVLDYIGVKYD